MKYLFHLVSGQTTPNYIAYKEINPDKNILISSEDTRTEVYILKKIFGNSVEEIRVKPFSMRDAKDKVESFIKSNISDGDEVILNFTGGTKLTSIALFDLFSRLNATRIYIDTQNERFTVFNRETEEQKSFSTKIPVDDFFILNNQLVVNRNEKETETQARIREYLMGTENKKLYSTILKDARNMDSIFKGQPGRICSYVKGVTHVKLGAQQELHFSEQGESLLRYMFGGWFETACRLKLEKSGYFDSIAQNVLLKYKDGNNEKLREESKLSKNELDIFAVKGIKPFLFECKSGGVKTADLDQLIALKDKYVGRYCTPVIVTTFPVHQEGVVERAREYKIKLIKYSQLDSIGKLLTGSDAHIS